MHSWAVGVLGYGLQPFLFHTLIFVEAKKQLCANSYCCQVTKRVIFCFEILLLPLYLKALYTNRKKNHKARA